MRERVQRGRVMGSTHHRFPFDFNSRPFDSYPGPQTNLGLHAREYFLSFSFYVFFTDSPTRCACACALEKGMEKWREREREGVYENIKSVGCKDCELRGFCSFASFSSTLPRSRRENSRT